MLYADILMLLWKWCRRSRDYGLEKATMTALLEEYLLGLAPDLTWEDEPEDEPAAPTEKDPHIQAVWLLAQLRDSGWLEDVDAGYEEDARTVIRPQVVPLLRAMENILEPQSFYSFLGVTMPGVLASMIKNPHDG